MVRWDVQSYQDDGPEETVHRVAMSPDGRFVASVGGPAECWRFHDAASGVVCMTGARHDGTGSCSCSVTRSGARTSLDAGCPAMAHTCRLEALAFSPCGQSFATGGRDNAVILWDAQTGKAELVMQGKTERVSLVLSLSFSADGERLASGNEDGSIHVWDATTGALLRVIAHAHNTDAAHVVNFSPTRNRILLSMGYDALQWDVDSGELISSSDAGSYSAVFSPDGRTIATSGSTDASEVLLVDAETGELLCTLVGHSHEVTTAAFSVDGSKLASGCFQGDCCVWDSSTGALLRITLNLLCRPTLDDTLYVDSIDHMRRHQLPLPNGAWPQRPHPAGRRGGWGATSPPFLFIASPMTSPFRLP